MALAAAPCCVFYRRAREPISPAGVPARTSLLPAAGSVPLRSASGPQPPPPPAPPSPREVFKGATSVPPSPPNVVRPDQEIHFPHYFPPLPDPPPADCCSFRGIIKRIPALKRPNCTRANRSAVINYTLSIIAADPVAANVTRPPRYGPSHQKSALLCLN